jgi:hypothetical protein
MKWNTKLVALVLLLVSAVAISAQTETDQKTRQRTTASTQDKKKDQKKPGQTTNGDRLEPDESSRANTDVPEDAQANRR